MSGQDLRIRRARRTKRDADKRRCVRREWRNKRQVAKALNHGVTYGMSSLLKALNDTASDNDASPNGNDSASTKDPIQTIVDAIWPSNRTDLQKLKDRQRRYKNREMMNPAHKKFARGKHALKVEWAIKTSTWRVSCGAPVKPTTE